jgi:hypothetical protein
MVTKIKISNEVNQDELMKVIQGFWSENYLDLQSVTLCKDSNCGKYEYIFVFCEEEDVKSLINIFLRNKISIFEIEDVTDYICEIVNSNKSENFKNELSQYSKESFDDIISNFILEHITKDMVLDKINLLGIQSLTEQDYSILKI